MILNDMRRAIEAAPRAMLPELAAALWKTHAAGSIADDDAQALAELIQARKVIPVQAAPRRRVGSRPRSAASVERRRRWSASGFMPPAIAARFTQGENAALAVVAAEIGKTGLCRLTLGAIAALAGVCRTTAKNALREARALGLVSIEERRVAHWRNAPNTVRVISAEWSTWLRIRAKKEAARAPIAAAGGGIKTAIPTNTRIQSIRTTEARVPWKPHRAPSGSWSSSALGVHAPRR